MFIDKTALKRSLPAGVAIAPVGFLFGILAFSKMNWNSLETSLLSILAFTGSGQFAIIPLLSDGNNFWTIVLILISINMRYIPMAYFGKANLPKSMLTKSIFAHFLGDEAYTIEKNDDSIKARGTIRATIVTFWVFSTALGAYCSQFVSFDDKNINLAFPASVLLMCLSYVQIRDNMNYFSSSFLKILVVVLLSTAVVYTFILLLGSTYFWIPSIVFLAIMLPKIVKGINNE